MVLIEQTDDIINMLKAAIKNENLEFELLYGKAYKEDINKEKFADVLNYCKDNYDISDTINSLDIRYLDTKTFRNKDNNYRLTINGLPDIKKYCNTNIITTDMDIDLMEKKEYEDKNIKKSYKNNNYNFKINLKTEESITENIQQLIDAFNNNKKYFRYKKRYSFLTDDRLLRIDLTVVKSSKFNEKFNTPDYSESFKNANILNEKETYEIEIEYTGSNIKLKNGLLAIENYLQNTDIKKESKPYNIFGSQSSSEYTESDTTDIEDYINKKVTILDDYWTINKDLKIKDDFYDKEVTLIEIFYNYDGEIGTDTYVKVEKDDGSVIVLPFKYINIKDKLSETEDVMFESLGITSDDLESIALPSELKDIKYDENDWFPTLDNIFDDNSYKMSKNPKKDSIEYFQLLHLFKFINNNTELIINKSTIDAYRLGPIKKISPYLVYKKDSYILKYKVLEVEESDLGEDSINIKVEQNPEIMTNILSLLDKLLYDIVSVVIKEDIIVSSEDRKSIINQYYELTKQSKKYYKNFVGPQPRQLKIENLYIKNPVNILQNYLVTEKADGDRYLMYVNKEKNIYLINKKNEVIDTGLNLPDIKGEWLLDGEYIKKDKFGEEIRLFMIFDVYYCENNISKKAYSHPFISDTELSRFVILDKFKSYLTNVYIISEFINDENRLEIEFKSYEKGFINNDDGINDTLKQKLYKMIFNQSAKIWKKRDSFRYDIDGLIYLPSNLPVKSNLSGIVTDNISGTWDLNFKWKPAYENTIDFQVSIRKELVKSQKKEKIIPFIKKLGDSEVISKYKQFVLYVKYYEKKDNTINHCMEILSSSEKKYKDNTLVAFAPPNSEGNLSLTNIELVDNKLFTLKDKREIKDNDLVEMRYNPQKDSPLGPWEPLRIRSDKKEAQAFHISNDVWDTIQNELTEEMIMGDVDINTDFKNDNYYDSENIITVSSPMRKFHNLIKSKLIGLVGLNFKNSVSILDTSIGRGGDIKKYLVNTDCKYLLGLDISPVNEACKRFYEEKSKTTKAMFIQYDTSKSIQKEKGYIGTEEEINHSKHLINIIYNKKQSIPKEYESVRSNYNSIALSGFDIISCQFTLHYYFKNEKTLRNYLENISSNCNKNGIFIGTCYDGNDILELFGDDSKIEYIKDKKLVYRLKKRKIKDFVYDKDDISNMFGNSITVYMDSIGDEYTEYLVNFEFFVDIMKEYGFELYQPEKTNSKYTPFINKSIDSFGSILKNLPKIKNDPDLDKFYKKSLDILKDVNLYNLSKTNNYFIFRKVD